MTIDLRGVNGLLPVHKPRGMISKDVSRWFNRQFGAAKLGHVGTLDPMAEGVLPLLIGRATRLQDYLLELPKRYTFDVTFGTETDTLDADGEVVGQKAWEHLTKDSVEAAAASFVGPCTQTPPLYSAVKYKGKSLYKYARGGGDTDAIPLKKLAKTIEIFALSVSAVDFPVVTFELHCSKGTYVRVLAQDIARSLDTCGMVSRMVRSESSGVELASAYSPDELERRSEELVDLIIPLEEIKLRLTRWKSIEPVWTRRLRSGQTLKVRSDLFERGLQQEAEFYGGESQRTPLYLLDERGAAFGLGEARSEDGNVLSVTMKRGLL